MAGPDLGALEQKYRLPPGLLAAQQTVESGGRDLTSPAGAQGPAQLMPATAAALHVNPHDPVQAAEAQARLNRQNLDATGGDIDRAMMMYHGGPNTKIWGPKTAAYPGKILAALQSGQQAPADSSDPFEQALSNGHGAASNDPFEAALSGDKPASDAAPVPPRPAGGPDSPGGEVRVPGDSSGVPADVRPGVQGPSQGLGLLDGAHDFVQGASEGVSNLQNDVLRWGLKGTDALGLTDGGVSNFDRINREVKDPYQTSQYANPDGWSRSIGNFAGEAVAGAPLTEIRPLQALGLGGRLARYGNMAIQGGAFGGVASGGENVGRNVALGAALAPIAGVAGDAILPPAMKLGQALKGKAGEVLSPYWQKAVDEYAASKGGNMPADPLAPPEFLRKGVSTDANGNVITPEQIAADDAKFEQSGGLMGTVTDDAPPHADPADLKAAGARSGIEATTQLPQTVAADVARLKGQGVQGDHALNEASIRYVGGEPTVATSTRERAAMQAEKEGAKLNTPEGQALAARAAQNNAALHGTVQETVQGYGGVPADGSAAQAAAESLAKASDAAKTKVTAAYENARALDGDQRVSIDGVRELLNKPEYKAPTTAAGKELVNGLRAQIGAMAKENGGRFSPEEIDGLTKAVNAAYDPMGGGVNHMVGDLKTALSESLDQFDKAGPAFREARAAHRQWAEAYDDPAGIANLIKRDAKGNFLNADNWRSVEQRLVNGMSDKAFSQVVAQLKASGGEQALSRLKASIVQDAYENATRTAADETGHPVMSAKAWEAMLNKIGLPKLQALFSPDEIAHLSTIGRAARALNEGVPGTVNGSGTSSALINALRAQGKGASSTAKVLGRVLGHGVAAVTHPVVGNVAVEAAVHGADATANKAAGAKLAKAINENLDPEAARATANDNAISAAEAARRKALAQKLTDRLAPAGASTNRQGGQ